MTLSLPYFTWNFSKNFPVTALTELKSFQNFIYRNFEKHEKHKEMRPTSSQPARSFATAKTHKFIDIKHININDLKLRPIIDQTGTHSYNCSKIIAQYLQPLAINEYTISDIYLFLISLEKTR